MRVHVDDAGRDPATSDVDLLDVAALVGERLEVTLRHVDDQTVAQEDVSPADDGGGGR